MRSDKTKYNHMNSATQKGMDPYNSVDKESPFVRREPIELFRKTWQPGEKKVFREREKRIKFEIVDDSPETERKLKGFDPYDTAGCR